MMPSKAQRPALTVEAAVQSHCSTAVARGLSIQLVQELECLRPGSMLNLLEIPGLKISAGTFPYLQTSAALALRRAAGRKKSAITINSALRTVVQQWMLYRMARQKRCEWEVSVAARPGRSHHESGLAVDIDDYKDWRSQVRAEGFRWYGYWDPVHFFYWRRSPDLRRLSVLAFQRLWNRNHPEWPIELDGVYGPRTSAAIARAPVAGFARGACGARARTREALGEIAQLVGWVLDVLGVA